MTKVVLQGHITVPEDKLAEVERALVEHIALTRQEPGCLVFEVEHSIAQRGKFEVYEEFVDAAAFAAHQRRVASSPWGELTAGMAREYSVTGLEEDDAAV
ncbi:MAG: putative quinol monooxygenase [Pseudomonadales bacterium]